MPFSRPLPLDMYLFENRVTNQCFQEQALGDSVIISGALPKCYNAGATPTRSKCTELHHKLIHKYLMYENQYYWLFHYLTQK